MAQIDPALSGTSPAVARVEHHSIDHIPSHERHGKAWHQGPFWFAGNFVLVTLFPGFTGPALGLGLGWTIAALVMGVSFGTIFAAFHANQGPRLGLPQMIQSRAQFGSRGAALPCVAAVFIYIGFSVFGIIVAAEVLDSFASVPHVISYTLFAALASLVAIVGHDLLHMVARWVTWILFVAYFVFTCFAAGHLTLTAAANEAGFNATAFIAQFVVAAAFQLSYAVFVSDYSRYLPEDEPAGLVIGWTFAGMALSAIWLMSLGALLASTVPDAAPVGTLEAVGNELFSGFGSVIVLLGIPALLSITAVNMYGATLTSLSAVDAYKKVRPTAAVRITGIIVVAVTIAGLALLIPADFLDSFNTFLAVLLTLLVPWTAINLTDFYLVRRGHYSPQDILDADGVYGRWAWPGLTAYLISLLVMLPFMHIGGFQGPVAALIDGVDVSFAVGLVAAFASYYAIATRKRNSESLVSVASV